MRAKEDFGEIATFDRRTTILSDPLIARDVLGDRSGAYEIRENFLQKRLTPSEIAEVRQTRKLLNPGLRKQAAVRVEAKVAALTHDVLVGRGASSGLAFDPTPLLESVIARAVADYYFGEDGAHLPVRTGGLLDALALVIGNPFALPTSWNSPTQRRIAALHREVRDLVVELLIPRAAAPDSFGDLASDVVSRRDPATQTLPRVADLLLGSLLAAQRVPAAAASWMLMLVADHPRAQERLQKEARHFGGASGTGDAPHSGSISYGLAVVFETLRLYPPTWLLTRATTRSVDLAGYRFPRGHNFLMSPYVMHRDAEHYDTATAFLPERWITAHPPRNIYLPFGWGRHACPGADLASKALVAILLTVVRTWSMERVTTMVTPDPRTTLLPKGLRLQLIPR